MSDVSDRVRAAVAARADYRCEYCRLPSHGQVATFPVDHVVPRTGGGLTELANLALACPHCNAHKWAHVDGFDKVTGQSSRLYNPRIDKWHDHFTWSADDACLLEGTTVCGRATIARLRLNDPELIVVRRLLTTLELFSR